MIHLPRPTFIISRMRASNLCGSFRFNMAPVGERNDKNGTVSEDGEEESQNLWYMTNSFKCHDFIFCFVSVSNCVRLCN